MQQQQQQQHLMPMMPAYYSNNVTTDHIQQRLTCIGSSYPKTVPRILKRVATQSRRVYLDENKSLILKIVESQNSGKLNECAENQAKLQRNLMYLAAIADAQPQQAPMHSQYPQSSMMQSGSHYMQQQQAQQMTPQALMAARSSMLYSQQAYSALQQGQSLHGHMGMSSGGSSSGLGMLQGDPHAGMLAGGYSDYGRPVTAEARGVTSVDADGLYLKSGEDGN